MPPEQVILWGSSQSLFGPPQRCIGVIELSLRNDSGRHTRYLNPFLVRTRVYADQLAFARNTLRSSVVGEAGVGGIGNEPPDTLGMPPSS